MENDPDKEKDERGLNDFEGVTTELKITEEIKVELPRVAVVRISRQSTDHPLAG